MGAAAQIPDAEFLGVIERFNIEHDAWCCTWDLAELIPDVPMKVVLAKARKLIARGLLRGCACGCRGEFMIPGWDAARTHGAFGGAYQPIY